MAWARIDDNFFANPKIRKAGPEATMLYLASLTYCNQQLTDGFIPEEMLPILCLYAFIDPSKTLAPASGSSASKSLAPASILLEIGLWHVVEGGYEIHDYMDFNASKQEIDQERQRKRIAGRKGGLAKAGNTDPYIQEKQPVNDTNPKNASKTLAPASGASASKSLAISHPIPSHPIILTGGGGDAETQEIFTIYSNNMGVITPILSDAIKGAIKKYTASWVKTALQEAINNNVHKWGYVESILARWEKEGFQSKPGNPYRKGKQRVEASEDYRRFIKGDNAQYIKH